MSACRRAARARIRASRLALAASRAVEATPQIEAEREALPPMDVIAPPAKSVAAARRPGLSPSPIGVVAPFARLSPHGSGGMDKSL